MKLRGKTLLFVAIPLLVTSAAISVLVSRAVTSTMEKQIRASLQASAYIYRDDISNIDGNDYYLDEDGNLWNGQDYNVSEDTEILESLAEQSGIYITVFYQDTRVMSSIANASGESIIGTKAGGKIVEDVLKSGNEYFAPGEQVEGNQMYGYYVPIYNDDDSVVGMIFAGQKKSFVNKNINQVILGTIAPATLFFVISMIVIYFLTKGMAGRFTKCAETLKKIADGDLTSELPEKILVQKDESGIIGRACRDLQTKFTSTLSDIVAKSADVNGTAVSLENASEKCAGVISQVENAVNDIAVGAAGQAEDTEKATERVIEMGTLVQSTNDNVSRLTEIANDMEHSGKEANDTLEKLGKVNAEAKEAIAVIYEQTNTTNDSALKINEAVSLITEIAEETNLLSLNASIEAARAGEAGRGFAVVAAQIQKLAEQSNKSALTIEEIISALISDSTRSVETMNQVKEIMERQSEMVAETEKTFNQVIAGIESSREGINDISYSMTELNKVREGVVDIVTGLSSIAEENAASTQETSASATEVAANVQQVSASATSLKGIAEQLSTSVAAFKIK